MIDILTAINRGFSQMSHVPKAYIPLILAGLMLLDVTFTIYNLSLYKKLYPEKDALENERNPIIRFLWRRFGLTNGTLIAIPYLLILLYCIVTVSVVYPQFFFFLMGLYFFVMWSHIDFILRIGVN